VASDNSGGSGVASITLWTTGAQTSEPVDISGKAAYVLIDTEGQTTLNFYATDLIGNASATQARSIKVDDTGPRISVDPIGIRSGAYEVLIRADDASSSGIAYIAVRARGAEFFSEVLSLSDETTIQLTMEGETELTITSVDIVGNITTLSQRVTVPEISEKVASDDDQNDSNPGWKSNGSSFGLSGLSVLLMLWILRVCLPMSNQRLFGRASR
jgi:hypothetical protein